MRTSTEIPIFISLQELKLLGFFPRCQDIDKLLAEKLPANNNLLSYPLFKTRLTANAYIDILTDSGRWIKTKLTENIQDYIAQKDKKYIVAPVGYYTDNNIEVQNLEDIKFSDSIKTVFKNRAIKDFKLIDVTGPYLTFEIKWYNSNSTWVDEEDFRYSEHTFHVTDPRIQVNGIPGKEPFFNEPIAISHRWLSYDKPDPDGLQFQEFLSICEQIGLHDCQPFMFDYCSLPQHPRTNEEEEYFRKQLPIFLKEFIQNVIVLNEGSSDYETRAWCMLELMLSAFKNSIINQHTIQRNLNDAVKKAREYVKHAGWSDDSMQKHFTSGLTNVAIYNHMIDIRNEIENLFVKELHVTDERDRPIILDLVRKFCFSRGE